MLAKAAETLPAGEGFLYEPKWDGFRAIVFRGTGEVYIQSRDLRPLDRYFPELHEVLLRALPDGCVVDGEIVIATPDGLDFEALQLRLHPAASRAARLAKETPASFVAFDALAVDGRDVRDEPQRERRAHLERLLAGVEPPIHLTPLTRDRDLAVDWLQQFEGAGLDGVVAKPEDGIYEPGKRDDQGEARAHGRLRGGRFPLAQEREGCRGIAAARSVRRPRKAAARGRYGCLHDGDAESAGRGARAAAKECARRASLARMGRDRRRVHAYARWSEPLERRQGPVMGTAPPRAGLRGEVRPPAGKPVPPCHAVSALAPRQGAGRLQLRPARGHDALRAGESVSWGQVLNP